MEDGTTKSLDRLSLGERVAALNSHGNLVYSEVIAFLDRSPDERRQFVQLTTETGRVLTLTPAHLVPVEGKSTTFAARVRSGDRILVRREDNDNVGNVRWDEVTRVELVLKDGVFAPLTIEGTLVVDDVVASCYAIVDSQTVAHYSFLPLRVWKSFESGAYRMARFVVGSVLSSREPQAKSMTIELLSKRYQPNGVHWYASMLYYVSSYVLPAKMLYY